MLSALCSSLLEAARMRWSSCSCALAWLVRMCSVTVAPPVLPCCDASELAAATAVAACVGAWRAAAAGCPGSCRPGGSCGPACSHGCSSRRPVLLPPPVLPCVMVG